MRRAPKVTLSAEGRTRLRAIVADRDASPRVRQRARILIQASRGRSNLEIAEALGIDVRTVSLWRRRYEAQGLERGLRDAPRQWRRRGFNARTTERILYATYNVAPPNGRRWTTRSLSRYLGASHMLVHRIWKARGVEPGKTTNSSSRSPGSASSRPRSSSFLDVLGLLVKPPNRALALGIQNVEGTAPVRIDTSGIRPTSGRSGAYLIRPGYASAEDLMYIIEGIQDTVREEGRAKPSVHDLLNLLRELDQQTPTSTQVHVITEPRSQEVGMRLAQWLESHPRFFLHAGPAKERWSDRVRSFLQLWHPSALHRSSFARVPSLALAAMRYAGSSPAGGGLFWSIGSSSEASHQTRGGGIHSTGIAGPSAP